MWNAFSELEPRTILYPRSEAIFARSSPSPLGEMKTTIPLFRKAAVAAKRSLCQSAKMPGSRNFPSFPHEIRRLFIQNSRILQKKRFFMESLPTITLENKKIIPIIGLSGDVPKLVRDGSAKAPFLSSSLSVASKKADDFHPSFRFKVFQKRKFRTGRNFSCWTGRLISLALARVDGHLDRLFAFDLDEFFGCATVVAFGADHVVAGV